MDSKSALPTSYNEEPAPPSYNETISTASSTSHFYGAQIRDQLIALTQQISSLETQRSLLTHENDERILAILAAEMQLYLSGFAASGLRRGALILVPAQAVQEGATPMEYDFRDPEEYDQLVRVKAGKGDEGGNAEWYWKNEEMAGRLARYLSPTPVVKELPPRRAEGSDDESIPSGKVFRKSTQSSSLFGTKKKGFMRRKDIIPVVERPDVKVHLDMKVAGTSSEDQVVMDVKAEEVSFRKENDLGLFETERGWTIVLKLKVNLDKR